MNFYQKLNYSWQTNQSLLCIGLDPQINKMPPFLSTKGGAIYAFCKEIVDATADVACAFKPQIAYFSAYNAEDQLEQIISYIHENYPSLLVILDSKRADIGTTAEQYAIETFERYQADAVTLNPYMGFDAIEPFLSYENKGAFILCRTSNKSGDEVQNLMINGDTPLYIKIANLIAKKWNINNNLGLVVGATYPNELAMIRKEVGDLPILIPGIGVQGGDIDATLKASLLSNQTGVLLNSSRAILYASSDENFAQAARDEAIKTNQKIHQYIQSLC